MAYYRILNIAPPAAQQDLVYWQCLTLVHSALNKRMATVSRLLHIRRSRDRLTQTAARE